MVRFSAWGLAIASAYMALACLPSRRALLEADDAIDGAADAGCIDKTGFGGRGCFRCVPKTNDELLSACTSARFEAFDNGARIAGFDPSDPRPALPEAGPPYPVFDAGLATQDAGAESLPPCPLDSKPNPVMILGATGFPMNTLARGMGSHATIFYQEEGSCRGVASIVIGDPKLEGTIVYYDATTGEPTKCALREPHPADLTMSTLSPETCASKSALPSTVVLPPDVELFLGPITVMNFAVPAGSPERVVSAEAAYRVYGFGNGSGVAPWTDESFIFRRTQNSGNQTLTALSLGLPVDAFRGRDSNGSTNMLYALQTSPSPARTIGISSCEIVDTNRQFVKALAYKHYGQPVGFYPDSEVGSFDRRNVRDGHYFLWSSLHVFVRTRGGDPVAAVNPGLDPDGSKAADRNAAVGLLTLVMVSRVPPPVASVDLLTALKMLGNVPQCAMRVTRRREGAPLEPFTPERTCACAWEATSPGSTPTGCVPCTTDEVCPLSHPRCSFGYCE
jgi:hypothetical protein